MEISQGELYLYVLSRNNDSPIQIAQDLGCPGQTHVDLILVLNKKRYPALRGKSKLEPGTRILIPDCLCRVLKSSDLSPKRSRALLHICQVCDLSTEKTPGKQILSCASIGCGALVHVGCNTFDYAINYFCPCCMEVPLETEICQADYKALKVNGDLRFGNASPTAHIASFGIVNSRRAHGAVTSSSKSMGVESERMLLKMCALVKSQAPDLKFTSFVINLNSKFSLHIDCENIGLGGIIGFGDYTGGELWSHWLPEEAGPENAASRFHDVRNKLLVINGASPHMTCRFSGKRFTVVMYTRNGWEACDAASLERLQLLGFPLPDAAYMAHWSGVEYGDEEYRFKAAVKDLIKDKQARKAAGFGYAS